MNLRNSKLVFGARWLGIALACASVASCATSKPEPKKQRSKEYFSEKEYGVKASPRVVADGKPVPKGGGRFMVGNPYEVKGKVYVPKEDPNYNKNGLASWYGSAFHGRLTANGEVYDSSHLSAAHPTFPLPSYARVTNLDTGSSVIVRVNDRGPYHPGRIIDVSSQAADMLDMKRTGTGNVNVQYVGRARMDGHDMPFLMASYVRKGDRIPGIRPEGQIASGVMVASNERFGDQLQSYATSASPSVRPSAPMALAGRTPSGPSSKASAALAAVEAQAAALPQAAGIGRNDAVSSFQDFADLPFSGPLPGARPGARQAAAATYVAYAAEPAYGEHTLEAQARSFQNAPIRRPARR
ncbi:septal ring lytic transglycosylase RlpA family protein [Neorhizobium sp. NPDC001467]|uniref:septal ring lytic transglycosylase RlpA family protein n=1 Tax=Neorhizobium sp. NPDC001467 TaxID=3390595 RepID=UPI003CFDD6CE